MPPVRKHIHGLHHTTELAGRNQVEQVWAIRCNDAGIIHVNKAVESIKEGQQFEPLALQHVRNQGFAEIVDAYQLQSVSITVLLHGGRGYNAEPFT